MNKCFNCRYRFSRADICNTCESNVETPETPESPNIISAPAHYTYSKYQPKDVIREWRLNFNLGSAVKYIARAGRKDDIIQDLKKAKQFLEFEIEALENERTI